MTPLAFLPLAVALLACLALVATPYVPRVERPFTRLALAAFGPTVMGDDARIERRRRRLRSVHVGVTYRTYAARTLLYASAFALAGCVVGVYVAAGVLALLAVPQEAVAAALPGTLAFVASVFGGVSLSLPELFAVVLAGSAAVGVGSGAAVYALRWGLPAYEADARGRQIDESLSRTVAFTYALSRSGMPFAEIMRILARNRSVYGGAADEVAVAVKGMDHGGLDLVSAIRGVADGTPSESFEEFAENLANVLRSGKSLPSFLYDQYEYHHEEDETRQEQFLELLATLAEAYVSLLVVGPLLLITILVVIGLMGLGDTMRVLRVLAYLVVPLGTLAFVVYLDSITESLRVRPDDRAVPTTSRGDAPPAMGDGGAVRADAESVERFRISRRLRALRERFVDPIRRVTDRPATLLYATVPLGVASVLVRIHLAPAETALDVGFVDDLLVQAALFVLGTFALVQEYHRRRLDRREAAVPDLLERLANVNEAGMTVVESVRRVSATDLGALNDEVDRTWADVRLGADIGTAFRRLEARMRTPMVTRVVALITNAMRSSGDLGPVLRIAADDAKATRRLKRARRQEMATYLVVIYLSFAVFLVIVVSLTAVLIPNIPTAESLPVGTGAGGLVGSTLLSAKNVAGYTRLLFHTALVQAVASGLVAGQMGEEDAKNGAKHATAMLALAYATFLLL